MRKLLSIGVIFLFLGLSLAPSIDANVSKDSELVEITTEICGLNGGKQTVQITKEEADEIEQLIDDIEKRLDEVETTKETVEIFNEAIVELNKHGLLGGLSIKQAQRLVTGGYLNIRAMKFLEKLYGRNQGYFLKSNVLCLIAGRAEFTSCLLFFPPIHICGLMYFGILHWKMGDTETDPANGWVRTIGILGLKKWMGKFTGRIVNIPIRWSYNYYIYGHVGAVGFTGISIFPFLFGQSFFLGSALWVRIKKF